MHSETFFWSVGAWVLVLAKEIAGHFLKTALESGEGLGREVVSAYHRGDSQAPGRRRGEGRGPGRCQPLSWKEPGSSLRRTGRPAPEGKKVD